METQNYKVDFFAGILLVIGLFVGASVAYAVGQGLSALLADDIRETAWYQALAYLITFVTPILFFDFFVVSTTPKMKADNAIARSGFVPLFIIPFIIIPRNNISSRIGARITVIMIVATGDFSNFANSSVYNL